MERYTDTDYNAHVPGHIRDNYTEVVAGEYGGDWNRLADNLDRHADQADGVHLVDVQPTRVLAAWARSQAAATAPAGEDPTSKPPVRRGRPPKQTAGR